MCNEFGFIPPCEGLPGGATLSEYIYQVKIVSTIPTTFARIIGRQQVTSLLTAVARAKSGLPTPLFNGAALAALKPDGPDTLRGTGNVNLDVINSGVFNNSTHNCGMDVVGTGSYSVDTAFRSCKRWILQQWPPIHGRNGSNQQVRFLIRQPLLSLSQISLVLAMVPQLPLHLNGEPLTTFFSKIMVDINLVTPGNVHFSPGNYCFNGGVSILGPDIIANDVRFLITSGEFRIAGDGEFNVIICWSILMVGPDALQWERRQFL